MNLVSVIIPIYNRATVIGETIESLKRQSYTFWEAIIVDDGSTDNSREIVSGLSNSDTRIKLIQRTKMPKDASVCRNIGIENCRGKDILFLDSDDLLAPCCLEERVAELEKKQ